MKKAITYLTKEDAEDITIESQYLSVQGYCAKRGYELLEKVVDFPGKSENFLSLLKAEKSFDVLIVFKFDALYGKGENLYQIMDEFKKAGISIESVSEPSGEIEAKAEATKSFKDFGRMIKGRLNSQPFPKGHSGKNKAFGK